jgi:hypothetical protein
MIISYFVNLGIVIDNRFIVRVKNDIVKYILFNVVYYSDIYKIIKERKNKYL